MSLQLLTSLGIALCDTTNLVYSLCLRRRTLLIGVVNLLTLSSPWIIRVPGHDQQSGDGSHSPSRTEDHGFQAPQVYQDQPDPPPGLGTRPKEHGVWCRIKRALIRRFGRETANKHPPMRRPGADSASNFSFHRFKPKCSIANNPPANGSVAETVST